ncbi:putative ankyrin repeat protein RF_0381 [Physella acuta]|uniref:putative ankyrin repeat protein RF_0381 n=1 Tax=Physella acuta TaxID=109671 RepID=UPI0027DC56C5|nr:putative ankyrin repeat protein RF_0381 [Physella acuta]
MDEPVNLFNYLVGDLKAVDKNGMNALMWASAGGAYEEVDEYINKGYDIKAVDKNGRNALMYASMSGHDKKVDLLINRGSDVKAVDENGKNAFMYAFEMGRDTTVDLLINRGSDDKAVDENGKSVLMYASENGNDKTVELLINKGSDIKVVDKDGKNALMYASDNGNDKTVELLINKGSDIKAVDIDGKNALMYASRWKYHKTVELLINRGSDVKAVDKFGKNALLLALDSRHNTVTDYFINSGSNLKAFNKFNKNALMLHLDSRQHKIVDLLINSGSDIKAVDENGKSALMYASENGKDKIVDLLINSGSDIKAVDKNGKNALMYASDSRLMCFYLKGVYYDVSIQAKRVIELLIKSGADVNFIDKNGWSALMYAAKSGAKQKVELLVEYGCDFRARNKEEDNALDIASRFHHEDIVEFLRFSRYTNVTDGIKKRVDREKVLVKPKPSKEDDIIKQVLDLDISEDLVKKTLQKRLEDKGTTFESAEALTEAILKDKIRRPSTSLSGDTLVSTQLKEGGIEVKELLRCRNCYDKDVDTKFEPCGHLSCSKCGFHVDICPICKSHIKAKKNLSYIIILAVIIKEKVKDEKIDTLPSIYPEATLKDQQRPINGNLQEKHYNILRSNYKYLVEEIDGQFLTDHLFTKSIISFDDKQEVTAIQTRSGRTRALLDKILNAGPIRAFPEFINSLKDHYPHIAKTLYDEL